MNKHCSSSVGQWRRRSEKERLSWWITFLRFAQSQLASQALAVRGKAEEIRRFK